MAVHTVTRRGERRLVIDIRYRNPDGSRARFRRDAEVQTLTAARAEDRRRLAAIALTGSPWGETVPRPELQAKPAAEVACTEPVAPSFEDVAKTFLSEYAPTCLKPSTIHGYRKVIEKVLKPRIGATPINAIDVNVARKLDGELVVLEAKPSTRRNALIVLRSVLGYALEAKLLHTRPELPELPKVGRTVIETMTDAEFEKALAKSNAKHRIAFLLAGRAGLRAGEVRGLRWSDVDLDRGRLVVRQAICVGVVATPKSGHQRMVPLTDLLAQELVAVPKKERVGLVARKADGTPWKEFGLRQAFRRACMKAKLGRCWRFHDLRHLFVTGLFRAGVPANVAQALAGHHDLATTQRYAHATDGDLVAAIALLGKRTG